jgi:hypothetical protein
MEMKKMLIGAALAAGLLGAAAGTRADTISNYTFVTGTFNAGLASQFKTTVTDNGNNTVTFDFKDIGAITSNITEIYFQDGAWLVPPPTITSSSGVSWTVNHVTPANPPGVQNTNPLNPFYFSTDMMLSSQASGNDATGIGNHLTVSGADDLQLTFAYVSGKSFADVVTALNDPNAASRLAIAFHVRDIGTGSATYIGSGDTGGPPIIAGAAPLPSAAWAGSALLGLIALRRKFSAGKSA